MQQRQKKTVHGYVKINYKGIIPKDIIEIICIFYLWHFDTKIMNEIEQLNLANLILNRLRTCNKYKHIMGINFDLLYRGSEHQYLASKFHEKCDEKGATVTIIQNKGDFIFGGFASKSWPNINGNSNPAVKDLNAFLFGIKPRVIVYGLKNAEDKRAQYRGYSRFGPVFGEGTDLYVTDKKYPNGKCLCGSTVASTYNFKPRDLMGNDENYEVKDYEVFGVSTFSL